MSTLVPTDRRYAVRVGIARIALATCAVAVACAVLMIVAAVNSPVFAADFTGGTDDYRGLDDLGIVTAAIPLSAVIGAVLGRGRCRVACTVIVAITGLIVAVALFGALTDSSH